MKSSCSVCVEFIADETLVPLHGTNTDRARSLVYELMHMCFVLCNELPFFIKACFCNRLYGKTFTGIDMRLSRMMNELKRREAAEIHIYLHVFAGKNQGVKPL